MADSHGTSCPLTYIFRFLSISGSFKNYSFSGFVMLFSTPMRGMGQTVFLKVLILFLSADKREMKGKFTKNCNH
jgi:hypothetical protein